MHHTESVLSDLVHHSLDLAREQGATEAAAGVTTANGLSVSVRLGEVETIEHSQDQGLVVTVYFGQRKGSASTSDLSTEAIVRTVAAACEIGRQTTEDPANGLADAQLMATEFPDLDLYHPWQLSAEAAVELADEGEQAGRAEPGISNSDGASLSSRESLRIYANSHGFLGRWRGSRHSLACSLIAGQGEHMQTDGWFSTARAREDLEDASSVGARAAERTLGRLHARALTTRRVPVIYSAEVARGLVGHLLGAISGGALYRKSSFLLDKLGQAIMSPLLEIREEPLLPRGLASTAFDNEGVATRSRELVADGILGGYLLSSYSARRLGMTSTANAGGSHNILVSAGQDDLQALLKTMHRGLLITQLMGMGVNLVTGDYSRGAAGFWVENGAIVHPVQEITVAGRLQDMFMNIQAVGSDVDRRSSIQSGSLLIGEMTVAGN